MNVTQVRIEPLHFERLHESVVKVFKPETYLSRIEKVLDLAKKEGLTHLLIYADREHFANLHYFTGFDPRFEEALLILAPDKKPLLLLGNEGVLYATIIPYDL
ncbi:MAG: aminopeptidase P family N-terminal domain-containing protein, partial [Sphaerochaetaceae bacterium]|nr:aminopeptidase P family N-terminal domain-containing protein [Sphaerochaetaceae bacterium]